MKTYIIAVDEWANGWNEIVDFEHDNKEEALSHYKSIKENNKSIPGVKIANHESGEYNSKEFKQDWVGSKAVLVELDNDTGSYDCIESIGVFADRDSIFLHE